MTKPITTLLLLLASCFCLAQNTALQQLNAAIERKANLDEQYKIFYQVDWKILSDEYFTNQKNELKAIQADLNNIDKLQLETSEQITLDLLQFIIDDDIFNLEYESYLMPLNAEGGFLIEMVYAVRSISFTNQKQQNQYLDKLAAVPGYLQSQTELLRRGMETGKMVPKLIVENTISIVNDHVKTLREEESIFLIPLRDKYSDYAKKCKYLIERQIIPAYFHFQQFLKNEYLPAAPSEIGVSNITDGKEYYEQRVRYFTTLDISPDEVFEIGQQEVARIRTEMEAILKELNYEGSMEDFFNFLRTDPQFYATSGEEILAKAAWLSKKIEAKLPELFGKLPRMPFTVKPVPASIAPNYTAGRYSPGSYAQHRAGQYWVNTTKLNTRPLYALPALTLHEAVPGHHLQIMLAQEIENVPEFRKSVYLSAYGEGWGLYSEWLGLEAGMYEDPYDNFGRLTYEMWRACRLVVDVGMHYKGWTRQEAVDFMSGNAALSLHEVNTEINRYIGWPAQALSYKMGELKIKELRARAEKDLGGQFDLRAFHDLILAHGSILMSSLEDLVVQFIKEEKAK